MSSAHVSGHHHSHLSPEPGLLRAPAAHRRLWTLRKKQPSPVCPRPCHSGAEGEGGQASLPASVLLGQWRPPWPCVRLVETGPGALTQSLAKQLPQETACFTAGAHLESCRGTAAPRDVQGPSQSSPRPPDRGCCGPTGSWPQPCHFLRGSLWEGCAASVS